MSARTNRRGAGAGSEKAWASGRILTPEQRARKQEVDRRANRVLKKEVQERLALLENRVMQLERACPGITAGLSRVREPASQAPARGVHEPEDQKVALGEWPSTQPPGAAFQGLPPLWSDPSTSWQGPSPSTERNTHNGAAGPTSFDELDPTGHRDSWSGGDVQPLPPGVPSAFPYARDFGQNGNHNTTAVMATPAVHEFTYSPRNDDLFTTARLKPNGREITSTLSKLVHFVRSIPSSQICFDDNINQDLVVTAIVRGWDYALARYQQSCPLWNVLQLVDLSLFRFCNLVERLSVLRILHKMYLFEAGSRLNGLEGPLPAWYKPQASQQLITHEPVIDHLAWPRLREHLVLAENNVLTNKFWEGVVRNYRFAWNDQPLSSIHFDPETSTYRLSPVFESALHNVSNWRMDMPFMQSFPELANDIHPANYMPLTTIVPSFGLQEKSDMQRRMLQKGFDNSPADYMMAANEEEPDPIAVQGGPWHPQARQMNRGSMG